MRIPEHVKLYIHNAVIPRANQLSYLRKGETPNCYGFYTSLMYVGLRHAPTANTQEQVKEHLRK